MAHRSRLDLFTAAAISMAAALVPGTLSAQNAALGNVAGVVRDASGAVVPGATVTVTNTGTGAVRNLTTDSDGHYLASYLQPGTYEVVIGGGAFATVDRKNIPVVVGQTVTVDADLSAAGVSTQVEVTGEAPIIEADRVAQDQVIDQQFVNNLPVNSRRFDSFVLLTPNVVPDGTSGLISYRGVSGLYNSNLVDGENNNQAFFSEARGRSIGAPYVFPVDAIREFSSENSGYSAEFGQAAGGVINAITKSGTNQVHGDVYEYYRTPGWNAADPTTHLKPIKAQHQFGVSIGGPILHDKLFYHFTYDGYRRVTPITYLSTYNTATQSINDLTALCDGRATGLLTRGSGANTAIYPSTIPGITPAQCTAAVNFINTTQLGTFARNINQDILFPRLDWQATQKTHVSASFLWQNFQQPNGYNTSTTVNNGGVSQNGTANFHERFVFVNAETALTNTAANVVHFQWSRDLETDTTNSGGPAINITNLAAYGETSALPRGAFPDEHRIQITDIFSLTKGKHFLKVGADGNFIHEQIQNLFQGDGSFTYGTGTIEYNFANWIQDVYGVNGGRHYNSFTQVNDPITHVGADDFWNQNIDVFAEDAWKIKPKLLLSLGVRYDLQLVPQPDRPNTSSSVAQLYTSTINIDKTMVQPRIGLAWNPMQGTVVRAGYGIFYGLNSNSTYYTMRRENGVYQQQYNVSALTNPNSTYSVIAGAGAGQVNRSFNPTSGGTYAAFAPQGGIPEFTPPGPAPINQVTGTATPAVSTNLPASVLGARGLDPNFRNPQSQSYDVSVEQQLPFHTALSVGYVGNRAARLPIFVDANVDPASEVDHTYYFFQNATAAPVPVTVPYYTRRLATSTGSVLAGFSDVNSNYNSFVATVRKPLSNGIQLLANYTWAKAMDGGQVSGVNGTFNGTDVPLDPFAKGRYQGRSGEYALSDLNVKNRVVVSLVGTTNVNRLVANKAARYAANGWELSGAVTAQDGTPLTGFMATSPVAAINGDGGLTGAELSLNNAGTPGRVPTQIAPRNAFEGPGIHNVDLRVSRTFPIHERFSLQVFAEAFNITNHRNNLTVSTNLYNYLAPGATPSNTASGTVTCGATFGNGCITPLPTSSTAFGVPTTTSGTLYTPRQIQLTGKLYF